MTLALFCARCSEELKPGAHFVVNIEAFADEAVAVPDEALTAAQLRSKIEGLIKQLSEVSEREALDQVYCKLTIHLCPDCYGKWIENPAGNA
jgi:hypothetical protein